MFRFRFTAVSLTAIATAGFLPAQDPLFEKVEKYPPQVTPLRVPFPALRHMRAAWGDYDNDGWMDVAIMGESDAGPVTKLYRNTFTGGGFLGPFTFQEAPVNLPQVQDGALAWGDFDNDGDLDLAITGSRSAHPEEGDLVAVILRNTPAGPFPSDREFVNILPGPWLRGCRFGLLQWIDYDNDGDLDLFYSGERSPAGTPFWELDRTARIYRNDSGLLTDGGPVLTAGVYPESNQPPSEGEERDELLATNVQWQDFDDDGLLDVLVSAQSATYSQVAQIWLNRSTFMSGPGEFVRLGRQMVFESVLLNWPALFHWIPDPLDPFQSGRAEPWATVADWDMNGRPELATFQTTRANRVVEAGDGFRFDEAARVESSTSVRQMPFGPFIPSELPSDLLPTYQAYPLEEIDSVSPPLQRLPLRQVTIDWLGGGRAQWLGRVLEMRGSPFGPTFANPSTILLGAGGNGALGGVTGVHLGIEPRLAGCLEVVDVDRDDRPDLFQSGYDETLEWGVDLYRNVRVSANQPPSAPPNVRLVALDNDTLQVAWDAAGDAETPVAGLRYGVSVINLDSGLRLTPAMWGADGRRLIPGLEGLGAPRLDWTLRRETGSTFPIGTYRVEVRAFDAAGRGSTTPGVVEFVIPEPPPVTQFEAAVPWRDTVLEPGDFDNDGRLDLVQAGHSRTEFFPHGDVTLLSRNAGPPAGQLQFHTVATLPSLTRGAMEWGDADGDGLLDLAMSGRSNGSPLTHVYRNTGGGAFTLWQVLDPVEFSALAWADFDNDGDLDLMVSGYRENRPLLRLYRNDGGHFVSVEMWSDTLGYYTRVPHIGAGALAWADFDGDGDLDVFITGDQQDHTPSPVSSPTRPYPGYQWPPGVTFSPHQVVKPCRPIAQIYRNDGPIPGGRGWLFRPVNADLEAVIWYDQTFSGGMIAQAEWCDLDADGRLDLVVAGYRPHQGDARYAAPAAWVLRNEGPDPAVFNGHRFSSRDILPLNKSVIQTLTCADWDNDGAPDLLMSGHTQGVGGVTARVLHNRGLNFSLTSHLQVPTAQGPKFFGGPAAFGHFLENPHRLEAAVSGMWGWISASVAHDSTTRVFLPSPGANAPPSPPANLTATVQGAAVTFAWDASTDDTTPQIALTYNLSVERVDGQPGGLAGMADAATGRRRVERAGNVGQATTWTLRNLPPGAYRWRVQALDAALTPSGFATAGQTFVAGPVQPPGGTPPPPLSQWVPTFGGPTTVDLQAVIEARQVRFAVGRRGRILYAPRGQPFTPQPSGTTSDLYGVAMGPDAVLAVGDHGVILRSEDGWNWDALTSPTTGSLRCITHGDAGWVALGENGALRSADGIVWEIATGPLSGLMHEVVFAAGRYVAVGEENSLQKILVSDNGVVWRATSAPSPGDGALTGIAAHPGGFIAVGGREEASLSGNRRDVLISSDGLNWSLALSMAETRPFRKLAWGGTWWAAVSRDSSFRSINGVTWSETPFVPGDDRFTGVAVEGARFTTVGAFGKLRITEDAGRNWTAESGIGFRAVISLAEGSGLIVAVGHSQLLLVSEDGGHTWIDHSGLTTQAHYAVAHGNGRFVVLGDVGSRVSVDGREWSTWPLSHNARALAFGAGRFVAGGFNGHYSWSADGETWSSARLESPPVNILALAYGNGTFVLLENGGRLRTSSDGIDWTIRDTLTEVNRLTFAHDRFFATGMGGNFSGLMLTSGDGVTWQEVPSVAAATPGINLSGVARAGEKWLAFGEVLFPQFGGVNGVLLESPDLVEWTPVPVPTSNPLFAARPVFGGVLVAGARDTLLFSPDGISAPVPPAPPLPTLELVAEESGDFRLTLRGQAGQTVLLQASTDMVAWTTVETITLVSDTETVELVGPVPADRRFFRLVAP